MSDLKNIRTIQKTGKGVKLAVAGGGILFAVGLVTMVSTGGENGLGVTFVGMVTYLVGRVLKWWRHA